jgi:hypothetical protein
VTAYQSTGKGVLVVDYSAGQDYSDDALVDLSGSNHIVWAHGGVWPSQHSADARGFVEVQWSSGQCSASAGAAASPYHIMLLLPVVAIITLLGTSSQVKPPWSSG